MNSSSSNDNITFKQISLADVPEGVVPAKFDTYEEAKQFIKKNIINSENSTIATADLVSTNNDEAIVNNNIMSITTLASTAADYSSTVDTVSFGACGVNLYVNYGTSGANHTGHVTYAEAHTKFTGFTLGFDWEANSCKAVIEGKDIYAYCNGTLHYYLLIDGMINLYNRSVNLSGYAYAIH